MDWLLTYSYLGIILFLILTGCGLPIPEEVGILTAGGLAADGRMYWPIALAACIVGCLLGDSMMYYIGRRFGRTLLQRHRLWNRLITPEREEQIETQIKEHGLKVFFLARFLVGVRGPVYLTAGILKVPYKRFLAIDALAASIVNAIFFTLAYFYGKSVLAWVRQGEMRLTLLVAIAVVIVGGWYWFSRHRLKIQQQQQAKLAIEKSAAVLDDSPPPPRVRVPDDKS